MEQIEAKRKMLAEIELEEKELADRMLEKFAHDEREELEREVNRQRFQQQFASEAYKQKVAQEEARKLEKRREVEEERALLDQVDGNRDLIEEAKRVLLAKHAAELEGFLR